MSKNKSLGGMFISFESFSVASWTSTIVSENSLCDDVKDRGTPLDRTDSSFNDAICEGVRWLGRSSEFVLITKWMKILCHTSLFFCLPGFTLSFIKFKNLRVAFNFNCLERISNQKTMEGYDLIQQKRAC
jgi:hypothetical protein